MQIKSIPILGCAAFVFQVSLAGETMLSTESCPYCKRHYSHCFDGSDYTFFGRFIDDLPKASVFVVYYRAPHGPTPSSSSTWTNEFRYDRLRESMITLRRETYESFVLRNRDIAEHGTNCFRTPAGATINIRKKPNRGERLLILARAGFSKDGRQALICTDSMSYLYENASGKWKEVGKFVRWIP